MRRPAWLAGLLLAAAAPPGAAPPAAQPPGMRFGTVEVYVQSGPMPLAAWQLDLRAEPGSGVRIAGIEGGEHRVFAEPPYYDTRAIEHDRVIIAGFSTAAAEHLPRGRTRVATIHYAADGGAEPRWRAELTAAATAGGAEIDATVSLLTGAP